MSMLYTLQQRPCPNLLLSRHVPGVIAKCCPQYHAVVYRLLTASAQWVCRGPHSVLASPGVCMGWRVQGAAHQRDGPLQEPVPPPADAAGAEVPAAPAAERGQGVPRAEVRAPPRLLQRPQGAPPALCCCCHLPCPLPGLFSITQIVGGTVNCREIVLSWSKVSACLQNILPCGSLTCLGETDQQTYILLNGAQIRVT